MGQLLFSGLQASESSCSSFSTWSRYIQQHVVSPSSSRAWDSPVERALKELSTTSFETMQNTHANTRSVMVEVPLDLMAVTSGDTFAPLEPVDLILGALHSTYQQAHPGCETSLVFDESHGRISNVEYESLDWNNTVGWFTALVPSVMPHLGECDTAVDAAVKLSRDRTRTRSTNAKVELFMQLYHALKAKDQLSHFGNAWIVFNFVGSTSSEADGRRQHLHREPLPEECRALDLGRSVARLGLVEVLASIQEDGRPRVRFIYNTKPTGQWQVKASTSLDPALYHNLNLWSSGEMRPSIWNCSRNHGLKLVRHQPLLRTVMLQSHDSQADTETICCQVVLPWPEYARGEFSAVGSSFESIEAASRFLQEDSTAPFASGTPPYRVRCCRVAGSSLGCHDDGRLAILSIEMHHVLKDAPSMAIILDDWTSAY